MPALLNPWIGYMAFLRRLVPGRAALTALNPGGRSAIARLNERTLMLHYIRSLWKTGAVAGIASIPSREESLRNVIDAVTGQVDHVYVYLNGYPEKPKFLRSRRITVYSSQISGDLHDRGKFFALNEVKSGTFLSIDDDIIYPDNYVERMLATVNEYGHKAAIGVHGVIYPRWPLSFFDRRLIHFSHGLGEDCLVSLLGTGTVAFPIEAVGITMADFPSPAMADIWFARHLKRKGIPAIAVARDAGWLRDIQTESDQRIYRQTRAGPVAYNHAIRAEAPWGNNDIIERLDKADIRNRLSLPVQHVLDRIQDIERGIKTDKNLFRKTKKYKHDRRFLSALPFSDLLADDLQREVIYENGLQHLGRIAKVRKLCLRKLERTNVHSAMDHGTRLFSQMRHGEQVAHLRRLRGALRLQEALQLVDGQIAEEREGNDPRRERVLAQQRANILYEMGRYAEFLQYIEIAGLAEIFAIPTSGYLFLANLRTGNYEAAMTASKNIFNNKPENRAALRNILIELCTLNRETIKGLDVRRIFHAVTAADACDAESLIFLCSLAVESGEWAVAQDCLNILRERSSANPQIPAGFALYAEPVLKRRIGALNEILRQSNLEGFDEDAPEEPFGLFRSEVAISTDESACPSSSGRVSVIVTAYNARETLEYSVASVLHQSYKDIEVIIVDDCSKDGTWDYAVERFGTDSRVKLLQMEKNSGPYVCRNRAMEIATGTYITIHDADDVSHPRRFEREVASLSGGAMAVVARHIRMDRDGYVRLENNGRVIGDGPATLLFRREVVDRTGPFESVRTRGDVEFISRLEVYFGVDALCRLDDILLFALHSPGSNSFAMAERLDDRRKLFDYRVGFRRRHRELRLAGPAAVGNRNQDELHRGAERVERT